MFDAVGVVKSYRSTLYVQADRWVKYACMPSGNVSCSALASKTEISGIRLPSIRPVVEMSYVVFE